MRVLYYYPLGQFYPIKGGNDYIASGHLQYFQDRGAEVHLMLPRECGRGIEDLSQISARFPCVKSFRLIDLWIYRLGLREMLNATEDAAETSEFRSVAAEPFDLFFANYVSAAPLAVRLPRHVWKVVETHDMLARQFRGLVEHNRPVTTPPVIRDAELDFVTNRVEIELYRSFDRAVMISEAETDLVRRLGYSQAHYVPPMFPTTTAPPSERPQAIYDMVFVGSGNYLNSFGLNWFYRNVYVPYLRPNRVRFAVAGVVCDRMPFQDECVTKLGVIENLDSVYDAAKLVVVPIFQGTGVAIKLLEALAAGRAVVSTPQGARGLDNISEAFVCLDMAADPRKTAQVISDLLADDTKRERLGQKAIELMTKKHSREAFRLAMDRVIEPSGIASRHAS